MESVHQVPCLRKGIEGCLADFIIHRDERVRSGFRRTQQTAQVTRAWRSHVLREALFRIFAQIVWRKIFLSITKMQQNFFSLNSIWKNSPTAFQTENRAKGSGLSGLLKVFLLSATLFVAMNTLAYLLLRTATNKAAERRNTFRSPGSPLPLAQFSVWNDVGEFFHMELSEKSFVAFSFLRERFAPHNFCAKIRNNASRRTWLRQARVTCAVCCVLRNPDLTLSSR